jgi:hypothetical protein
MDKSASDKEVRDIFEELLNEYFDPDYHFPAEEEENTKEPKASDDNATLTIETHCISDFLKTECTCGSHCQRLFTFEELQGSRHQFRGLTTSEKNCFILSQLTGFSRHSPWSFSSRTILPRQRQKFEYRINIDRPVCKNTFLFYYGETNQRLKRLQKNFLLRGIALPIHGNKGCKPVHACSMSEREAVKSFINNFAANEGLPDPGRDVRKGKGKLRILLPSVMTYFSIHQLYQACINETDGSAVGYRTFLRIWQEELPHIAFNNPKTDLCIQCENFKKQINQIAAILNEEKELMQAKLYKEALTHLNHAKKERLYYRAHAKVAHKNYKKLISPGGGETSPPRQANSMDMMMHYSWDFAQQLQYPFEEQQVGPIYFKTPRRAQLFGVCCEGIPRQINYLIDEADFLEKNANTVISLLDHFFEHHGVGETFAYLTADNCVGQNKNNALIQYLMYRVLMGLHTNIELSFLVVGHTKFSPDGYFGLIRHKYRRSNVYTYEQLAEVVEESSPNGHNLCQVYADNHEPAIIYRNWSDWLAQYFNVIPNITSYHHFLISKQERGTVKLKQDIDAKEITINLINTDGFPYNAENKPPKLPSRLMPKGLSLERQWYLYDQIRMHIPDGQDKDKTCPKPTEKKPKNRSS